MAQPQQDDGEPILYLEPQIEIETNSKKWALESMHQTQQRSSISLLNNIYNSELAINKIAPDILYIIFTLAVHCPSSKTTALDISHVCHHWRESALQWPSLWAFVDLSKPPSIVDLFMKRSRDAPLALLWRSLVPVNFDEVPSKSYFISHANSILSRLCSLDVWATHSSFISLYHVIKDSKLPPLQLRRLAIVLSNFNLQIPENRVVSPLTHIIDNSCLREIGISGLELPWLELPHNKLTHFSLNVSKNPPTISQLLVFLSNCPLLEVLELGAHGIKPAFALMTPTSLQTVNKPGFPNLTTFRLSASRPSGYDYIWQFASCIRTLGVLSCFMISCRPGLNLPDWDPTARVSHPGRHNTPFEILKVIPPGAFSHFSKYQYFYIDSEDKVSKALVVRGDTSVIESDHGSSDSREPQFTIVFRGVKLPIDYSPVLELVHTMPQIQHLTIKNQAWRIFTLPNLDVSRAFPCLHTLALTDCQCGTEALNSIPAGLRVKRLILTLVSDISFDVLFDVVVSMGAEILDLNLSSSENIKDEIISALNARRVDVVENK